MKNIVLLVVASAALVLVSCQSHYSKAREEITRLNMALDSLQYAKAEADSAVVRLDGYLDMITESLDSIKIAEGIYTLNYDETGRALRRSEILKNLELLGEIVARQKDRIEELEARIAESPDSSRRYVALISHLRGQISEKETKIAQLQRNVSAQRVQIRTLSEKVDSLEIEKVQQADIIQTQNDAIAEQTETIKEMVRQEDAARQVYVLIASTADLRSKQIYVRQRFYPANVKQEYCRIVDSRSYTGEKISSNRTGILAKAPTVLSAMPAGSYQFTQVEGGYVLEVLDRGAFWSMSKILVVLAD